MHQRRATSVRLWAAAIVALAACDGSRDKLLGDLQSPRPNERALAVRKLAGQGRPDDLVLFTRAARDVAAMVRGEAASALGKSQDPRVVDLLGELLDDPDEDVQAKAAMALAEIKSDKSKAYLTLQYGRKGRSTRIAIIQALKTANVQGAMAQVVAAEASSLWERNLRALADGAPPEKVAAAEELGKSGRTEAVDRLLSLVKDSQVILAAAAVRGLGYAGDRRAVPTISELLTENFPQLREAACESLQRLGDPQALPVLKAVAVERSPVSPLATAAVIDLLPSPQRDQALCAIALEGSPPEAIAAGKESRRRGGCPIDPLVEALKSPQRAPFALQAIAGLGPTALPALPSALPYLGNGDRRLRDLAVQAVAAVGDPSAGPSVFRAYEQELGEVASLRERWITSELPKTYAPGFGPASIGPESEKVDQLFSKLHELDRARLKEAGKDPLRVRPPTELVEDATADQLLPLAHAVRALGVLKAQGAMAALVKHADDESPAIRSAAYAGLAYLGPDGIAAAKEGLFDADRDVQGAAATALAEQGAAGQKVLFEAMPRLAGDKLRLITALSRVEISVTAIPSLQGIVTEGGPEAAIAARLLGELKAKSAVDVLLKYLEDPSASGRREALISLGQIGEKRAADVVAKDLIHDSPEVRAAAAEALWAIGTTSQLEPLEALKGDYYRKVRESAERAFRKIGGPPSEAHK